jgi:hypothetical protein
VLSFRVSAVVLAVAAVAVLLLVEKVIAKPRIAVAEIPSDLEPRVGT